MPPDLLAELLAVVVPPACIACRAALPRGHLRVCGACVRALPWLPERRCERCGLPRHRRGSCPAARAAFGRAWSPLAYEGVARDLVGALKFRGALPLADLMAAHIGANLPHDLRAGVLVPVPAQPLRRRRRGFDPAAALSSALAPRLGVPEQPCLRRRDRGARQVGASWTQRRRPGHLTIDLRGPPPARARLMGDVHSTGATLDACARVLLVGGCREVVALTYARTL